MGRIVEWLERMQVPLYLAALAVGAVVGLALPGIAPPAEIAINPILALLLYATFLGIPFGRMREAVRDWRFLVTILVVNFVAVPIVVFALSRIVAHDRALLIGVLIVLLTPCVDYVIVFTGLAGGSKARLLVAAPLLMLLQMVLLPGYLALFLGVDYVKEIDLGPFVNAFVMLIVLPLIAALLTQLLAARTRWATLFQQAVLDMMVPLMMLTLAVVVASQIAGVRSSLASLMLAVPVFVVFAGVMLPLGMLAGRAAKLDVAGRRAIVFSGVTRNSLVVLPLVLALPGQFALAPLVVVTQTLVELCIIVIFVRVIPLVITGAKADSLADVRTE